MNNEEINEDAEESVSEQTEQIKQFGNIDLPNAKHCIHCLNIIGQVEGHHILPPQNKTTK